jgi:PAS domain S-box-containing protein
VVGTWTEIEEYKLAKRGMQELVAIVESSEDAIIGKTLDGIVTSCNRGAERLLGYGAEEVIGQPITRFIPPDRLDEETQILARPRLRPTSCSVF